MASTAPTGHGTCRIGSRRYRRAWRLRTRAAGPWTILFAVAILLGSAVPAADHFGTGGGSSSRPAVTSGLSASNALLPVANLTPGVAAKPSDSTLCILGMVQDCGVLSAAPEVAVTPDGDPVSAWTNITPPAGYANPSARELAAEVYDPAAHEVILFGGYGDVPRVGVLRDTWAYSGNTWTELVSAGSCLPTTCPSARAGAMLAYDPLMGGLILFGGYTLPSLVSYNDTWLFTCTSSLDCAWSNITSSAGTAPAPRYSAVMSYDPSDNYVLLFGGMTSGFNALGDTWEFTTYWTNLTSKEGGPTGFETRKAPEPRALASIAESPDGHVLVFGGVDSIDDGGTYGIIQNYCNNGSYAGVGSSTVAWWFYHGVWAPMAGWGDTYTGPCTPPPPKRPAAPAPAASSPDVSSLSTSPPCGREGAALGWSPKNNRFVLYGGYGSADMGVGNNCSTDVELLNDTWLYTNSSGGGYSWQNAGDPGDPPARFDTSYASDFTDGYFEITGGAPSGNFYNSTYRFYETVHARLTGPQAFETYLSLHLVRTPFVALGFGGSGNLTYKLTAKGLVNSNTLDTSGACPEFYAGAAPLPPNGTVSFYCSASPSNYNIYRLTLTVTDAENTSDHASATWVYEVEPPETMYVESEYVQYFYENVDLTNTFTVYAVVAGAPATHMDISIDGKTYTPEQETGSPDYWTVNVAMGSVPQGAILHAEGNWGNWTDNATYAISMIKFPSWLSTVFELTGANESFYAYGPGPYNKTYGINETYDWDLGSGSGFSTPSVDALLGAAFSILPDMTVVFSLTSTGDLGVNATLPITTPSINMGIADLQLAVELSLQGTFAVSGSSVHWVSAVARIGITASLGFSIPIYGFCILSVCLGITLQVTINASAALSLILAPSTSPSHDIMGIGVMIQNFLGSFSLGISAAATFSILIASVGVGVGVGIALTFETDPDFAIEQWYLNGSIFVQASFLFWSDSWNLISGSIASGDPPGGETPAAQVRPAYNDTGGPWNLSDRYYNVSDYDQDVWDPAATVGPAIDDLYPFTEVTGAGAYDGAYLFFTNDDVGRPVRSGIELSGEQLGSSTNALSGIPSPDDPGYLLFAPRATTLPNGSLYVVWDALPASEASAASPLDLTSIALQGAPYFPSTGAWGPVRTYSTAGFAGSYQVDATDAPGEVVELLADTPLLDNSTTERLVTYALATGATVSNVSVSGITSLVSARAGTGLAVVQTMAGTDELVDLSTGEPVAITYTPPTGFVLASAAFVTNSPADLALLYEGSNASELVLYDTTTDGAVGALAVGNSASEVEGLAGDGATYLFVRTAHGLDAWSETAGTFQGPTAVELANLSSYGLVQDGSSIVVYALSTNGASREPIVTLSLAEFGAVLSSPPAPPSVASGPPAGNPETGYLVDLAIAAGVVAVLLGGAHLLPRRRPPRPGSEGPQPWTEPSAPSPVAPPSPPPPTR